MILKFKIEQFNNVTYTNICFVQNIKIILEIAIFYLIDIYLIFLLNKIGLRLTICVNQTFKATET